MTDADTPADSAPADRKPTQAEIAFAKAEVLARRQREETNQATALVKRFAAAAAAAGVTPERLTARSYDGATRYRTNLMGWYLKRDRTVAVSVDGDFYVLSAPRSLASRFTGTTVKPSDAPIELGKGARDGESMPLQFALDARLNAGNTWP